MNFKLNKMFIYSCFIRINNERLKRELEHLGYDVSKLKTGRYCIATSTANSSAVEIDEESFDCSNPHRTWNCSGRIDCGKNEKLFLAIAALRDDSDINQWFVYNNTDWENEEDLKEITFFLCKEKNVKSEMCCNLLYNDCRKATIEELIKHFTKE